ncbi:hypothetical protein EA462_01930 [Natrarchaeobius halalkaliphilus]|uniref:LWR-salt protein n=1 Tax=Natrarchaeobius halalkaliphilus TaxID=1679091 RepID=A0A3N6LYP6_9EURY|nr:LWR-salt protein [Natrarchaeobius halalkaliphilus]RQG92994.1 hypothetical protein EA462_01930 [Natrarchaeobius halalkaliphilus]
MEGQYVFRVKVRLEPADESVSLEPSSAESTVVLFRRAPEPGTDGWRFFRDSLWRGEVNDQPYARRLAGEWLEAPVVSVSFRELRADEAYVDALEAAIADDLEAFNAENVPEVLSKYFGSSIRILDDD